MDTNELFWATGIDNSGLRANQQEAIQIKKKTAEIFLAKQPILVPKDVQRA